MGAGTWTGVVSELKFNEAMCICAVETIESVETRGKAGTGLANSLPSTEEDGFKWETTGVAAAMSEVVATLPRATVTSGAVWAPPLIVMPCFAPLVKPSIASAVQF